MNKIFFEKKQFIKIIFNIIFCVFIFFIFSNKINAESWTVTSSATSCPSTKYCSRGSSCPVCSSTSSLCCSRARKWTKYRITCTTEQTVYEVWEDWDYWSGYVPYIRKYIVYKISATSTAVCSTADKCYTGDKGLRYGTCSCSSGSRIYKLCCSRTAGVGPVNCRKINVDGRSPSEGVCPSGSRTIAIPSGIRDSNSRINAWIPTVCPSCTASNGSAGVCGSSDGETFSTTPSSNLCSTGSTSWTDSGGSDGTYNWRCLGSSGSCGGSSGSSVNCSAYSDQTPTFSSLTVKNNDGAIVAADSGNINQICDSDFRNSSNRDVVQFMITGADAQGVSDIGTMQVRLRPASGTTLTSAAVASVNGIAIIPVNLNGVAANTYSIEVLINDKDDPPGYSTWFDAGRDLKVWDCNVSVSGAFYDGSDGVSCPNFSSDLAADANFKSLRFVSPSAGESSQMSVDSGNSTYSDGGNDLIWGSSGYIPELNSDLAADIGNVSLKVTNVGSGAISCPSTFAFDLDSSLADPYSSNPSISVDFSAVLDQDAWFQSSNGGISAKTTIANYVPVTCSLPSCNPVMSINGLVSAPTINRTDGISYSSPNNWYVNSNLVSNLNFYEQYKSLGFGEFVNGDLNDLTGKEDLVMVDGNVNISSNKIVSVGDFLMIMASGDITIDSSVTRFDGVLVGRNINIIGTNSSQLVINGNIHALNNITISRSYTDKEDNNDSPAVKVNLRPDFLFNIPSEISKKITNWKWGN